MLNRNKVTNPENLEHLAYDMKVRIYDMKCSKCPSSKIELKRNTPRSTDCMPIPIVKDLQEAIDHCTYNDDYSIVRSCSEDDGYSLNEITMNTCELWGKGEIVEEFDDREGVIL